MILIFDTFQLSIPDLDPELERTIKVFIPDSFSENEELRYPVLYMFDGQNVFFDDEATYGRSWGMADYMQQSETQVIVVGIQSNPRPDFSRLNEYSPYTFEDPNFGHIEGKGDITMDWIINTLKPLIDENYPTMPSRDNTWIAGSSMGGLMSYYALVRYNEVFSGAIALSPSFWTAPKKLKALLRETTLDTDSYIYMDYGSQEGQGRIGNRNRNQFWSIVSILGKKDVYVTSRVIPNGVHSEDCWRQQVPYFMELLITRYQEDQS